MILPEKAKALRRCVQWLTPSSGKVYFTQTFEKKGIVGWMMPLVKRMLKFVLTIDFGEVTFEDDFRKVMAEAEVRVDTLVVMHEARLAQVLIVATPRSNVLNI